MIRRYHHHHAEGTAEEEHEVIGGVFAVGEVSQAAEPEGAEREKDQQRAQKRREGVDVQQAREACPPAHSSEEIEPLQTEEGERREQRPNGDGVEVDAVECPEEPKDEDEQDRARDDQFGGEQREVGVEGRPQGGVPFRRKDHSRPRGVGGGWR